jgi:ribosomal protein L7Ae-like RNA K-turn-binding protein
VVERLIEARRTQRLVTGASACRKAWSEGRLGFVILAGDSGTLREEPWLSEVVVAGKALGFATRAELATGLGQEASDLTVVLDEGLSDALSGLVAIGQLDWETLEGARLST